MESMDAYRQFFLKPEPTHHRRYEMLKAYFVERHKAKDIAKQFGLSHFTVYSIIRDFKESVDRSEPMQFFVETKTGPKTDRKKPKVREHVLRLRARGYADTDIHKALQLAGFNADIIRDQQQQIPLRFVDYWKNITGLKPQWLYFDSKMTTYSVLDQLHQDGINFITIRRRGAGIIRKILNRAKSDWTSVVIDTKQRRHQHIRYLDDLVKLPNYTAACRQITTDGLGRSVPTLFLTSSCCGNEFM